MSDFTSGYHAGWRDRGTHDQATKHVRDPRPLPIGSEWPDHHYELRCTVCGQIGTVRVSIDPVSESPTQCPKCLHLAHPGVCT